MYNADFGQRKRASFNAQEPTYELDQRTLERLRAEAQTPIGDLDLRSLARGMAREMFTEQEVVCRKRSLTGGNNTERISPKMRRLNAMVTYMKMMSGLNEHEAYKKICETVQAAFRWYPDRYYQEH